MTRKARVLATAAAIAVLAVATILVLLVRGGETPTPAQAGEVVRENSHRLNSVPDSEVTFVEFLDFECEGCKAVYPAVEQLRADYGDRVNFVIRYFPMPGHFNGERAARAVEAAAQQGRLEAMYSMMFDTQAEWGEQQVPADEVFRGFATELGLDMAAYDAAYADPSTLQRVQLDMADGRALGVQGTPTFFLNGTRLQPRSYDDLTDSLDEALSN